MEDAHAQLLQRIQDFPLDDPEAPFPFSERLARDQGWTLDFAHRAIREYRRFVYLAMTADHTVSPSDQVDQVWHEHLTYTRSYWVDFCGKVLGSPLHHEPTRGGTDEGRKFDHLYERTLASYRAAFGEEPPADLWPPAEQRFGEDIHFSRVNTARNWVIPKPRWLRPAAKISLFCIIGLTAGAWTPAALGPFDLRGPEFLGLFWALAACAFGYGLYLRWRVRDIETPPDAPPGPEFDGYSVALLTSRARAVHAAVAQLVQTEVLAADNRGRISPGMNPPHYLAPLERKICERVAGLSQTTLANASKFATPVLLEKERELMEAGLLVREDLARRAALQAALLCFGVVAIGAIKIGIGVARERPVGLLVASCFLVGVAAVVFLLKPARRTHLADDYLNGLRNEHFNLRRHPLDGNPAFGHACLPLAVGLYGYGVLSGTGAAHLQRRFQSGSEAAGTGCGGGGDSGSGCGGGGCGGCGGS